jgi:hypothetical protein
MGRKSDRSVAIDGKAFAEFAKSPTPSDVAGTITPIERDDGRYR